MVRFPHYFLVALKINYDHTTTKINRMMALLDTTMPPAAKRQRTTVWIPPKTIKPVNTVAPSPENAERIRKLLHNLRTSTTVNQAVEAMTALKHEINCREAAKLVVEMNGIATIRAARIDWHLESKEFWQSANFTLVQIMTLVH